MARYKIAPAMVQFCILGNIENCFAAHYNKTIESSRHMRYKNADAQI